MKELLKAESAFAAKAAVSGLAKIIRNLANNMKRARPEGAPLLICTQRL